MASNGEIKALQAQYILPKFKNLDNMKDKNTITPAVAANNNIVIH